MGLKANVTGPLFEKKGPEIINRNLTAAMYEAVAFLEKKVKEKTPQGVGGAQGGLLSTIAGEVINKGTPLVKGIVFPRSEYGEVIEKGRRANKTMPPSGVLIEWIEKKLGLTDTEAQRVEFLIRRKIGKKGFPGAQMFEVAFTTYFTQVQKIFDKYGFKIAMEMNG